MEDILQPEPGRGQLAGVYIQLIELKSRRRSEKAKYKNV